MNAPLPQKNFRGKLPQLAALFCFALLLFSCASDPFAKIDQEVFAGKYEEAVQILETEKKSLYGSDAILYYLDKGMIAHYAGNYEESSALLQDGERAIEDAFTKSVTESITSYIVNDKSKQYAGEDYEDLYLNVFNALNYYHQKKMEDAMVEIRRVGAKLQVLHTKYDALNEELSDEDRDAADYTDVEINFSNSALARYLGLLFYRAAGKSDDARIDRDWLKKAFADEKPVYPFPAPSIIDEELAVPKGKARLNVLAFSGLSPVKVEEVTRIPMPTGNWIKIALPEMEKTPSAVRKIELVFEGGATHELALLEDIQNVAIETFKIHLGTIKAKSIIRGTTKGGIATGLSAAGRQNDNPWLALAGLGAQAFAELSESADLRLARYFPGKASIGGVTLDPGNYTFSVNYYDGTGGFIESIEHKNFAVQLSTLNLVETYCSK
ncbi:MAG: hypothetical protein LBT01_09510 [Spirochaetaceae bacterium]|jgi:hypothetical protein|nr:hypothetical protein [Spirochaetaceae bacterium]